MATPHAYNILRVPGRLIKNPTNLSTTSPYGGTELGVVRNVVFTPGIRTEKLIAEEWGTPIGAIVASETPVLACALRSWDNDLIASIFPNVRTASSGEVGVQGTVAAGVNRTGYDMEAKAFKLLFAPLAPQQHRAILIYNAIPLVDEQAQLDLSLGREFGIGLMFLATPNPNGYLYDMDWISNLTL